MNKKIIAILALLIVAVSITAVSAFDLGDILGNDGNKTANAGKTVDIGGIKFNIPAGFEEDNSNTSKEIEASFKKLGLNSSAKLFIKDQNGIGIYVANYTGLGLSSDEVLNSFSGNSTTINKMPGKLDSENGVYVFTYVKDGCLILVSVTDKNLLNNVVIA
ncbi:hypothetical protein [Methanobrevibacter sp.]|uniref:hypothetical protein n=1 Tax=Methanobrevibacter sp. TaxID=66852 RepID=UPI00388D3E09